ncbi:helix-turn-helix domain-containing protein [Sagittula sp.]|uniref:helix-turn-helix domain-containing protein n=1 Tax=Sagittula sp. TaxID=2038081 RepID=UPI00351265F1
MKSDDNVIYHTLQRETSHSNPIYAKGRILSMTEGEIFLRNLLVKLEQSGMTEAELSVKAKLNRRAVTDLREGRVRSPKLSTVFALSRALGEDPGEMMGLGPRLKVQQELARYLEQYPEDVQRQMLHALVALRGEGQEPA